LATQSAITGPVTRAPHPHHWSADCTLERGCQAGVIPHTARIARSIALSRIQRVSCLLCLGCLCCQVQCDTSNSTVAPAMSDATLGTHAPEPLHPSEYSTGCVSQSLLRLRAFHRHVFLWMREDFVNPSNRVIIKHKVLCECVLGPCFLCAWTISVTGCHVSWDKQASSSLFTVLLWVFSCTLGYEYM